MPTLTPSSTPTTIDQGATAAGSGVSRLDHEGQRDAQADPEQRPNRGERGRLHHELGQDVVPPGAQRLPDPDLPGPLAHRHEHDVHDHDAADHQRDGHQSGKRDEQNLGDLLPAAQRAFRRLEVRSCSPARA